MKLLIAEKPSVGQTYKALLEKVEGENFVRKDGYLQGKNHIISWCIGHLVGLAYPEKYGWGQWTLHNLPMIPVKWEYEISKGTRKQFKVLAELVKRSDEIINGGDAGREGELIVGLVVMMAGGMKIPQKRLWLNSFVMKDMEKAWKKLEPAVNYRNLLTSAVARSKADWLVGMNGSRGYSIGTGIRGLSVGRVQTPTLALIVNRDDSVENWKDKYYFQLQCYWNDTLFTFNREGETKFEESKVLEQVKSACENKTGVIRTVDKKDRIAYPPKPFNLTDLQKEANKKLGFKAVDTLKYTQSLYEKKLVTYPRTDSAYLPESMKDEAFEILDKLKTAQQSQHLQGRDGRFAFFNSSKVTDHFAVIPTGEQGGSEGLSPGELKILGLITKRFVTAFGKPKKWLEYKIEMECEEHTFVSSVNQVLEPGYTALDKETKKKDEDEIEIEGSFSMTEGDTGLCKDFDVAEKKVTKPKYHTEATLLQAMETAGKKLDDDELREAMKEGGLGTPATRAQIIETLKKREYVTLKNKSIVSTTKGRQLIVLVDEKIKSPAMTGDWEMKLNKMAKGQYPFKDFMGEIENYVRELNSTYKSARAASFEQKIIDSRRPESVVSDEDGLTCPKCKEGDIIKTDKVWYCSRGKDACGFGMWRTVGKKKLSDKQLELLAAKGSTRIIKGFTSKSGKKFDAKLVFVDDRVKYSFDK
ncbi:MAG: topoisomerase C-terminal repeat-containing protein [Flavobacteriales bacterium]|nr:topoisomerase C-terminal repeat-containing protein [Flavobacteriales bacterium]